MQNRMKNLALVLGFIALSAFLWGSEPVGRSLGLGFRGDQVLATRYYARNRTSDFFQRSANQTTRKVPATASKGAVGSAPRR